MSFELNTWHHIAVTFTLNKIVVFYWNGVALANDIIVDNYPES